MKLKFLLLKYSLILVLTLGVFHFLEKLINYYAHKPQPLIIQLNNSKVNF
jgi:hypothetical protein